MNVFDILGPVMIGPSSSHTAGAVRIGLITRMLLGSEPVVAEILLHGSFARTYKGHGTDKALTAGILGMYPDDTRIRYAPDIAKRLGLSVSIKTGDIDGAHPNSAYIVLIDADGRSVSLLGSSIGGGNILITRLNNMEVHITGQKMTMIVLHKDRPGTIAAVTEATAEAGINIGNFFLSRKKPGGEAVMTIETDSIIDESLNERIKALPNVESSILIQPL